MPLYSISLRQAREAGGVGLYKWSNTFYIPAASAAAAAAAGAVGWAGYLRPAFEESVYCYEVYATDVLPPDAGGTPLTADYATVAIAAGDRRGLVPAAGRGDMYWRDACLVMDLNVFSSRPDRKFVRPGLRENDYDSQGRYNNTVFAEGVRSALAEFLVELGAKSGDNEDIAGVAFNKAGMRRMGRQSGFEVPVPPPLG